MSRPPRIPGTSSGRTLYLLPGIPDNLDEETKNGLAIRNAASANGICPDCGTVGQLHPDKQLIRTQKHGKKKSFREKTSHENTTPVF